MDIFDSRYLKSHHFLWIIALVIVLFLAPGLFLFQTSRGEIERVMATRVKDKRLMVVRSGSSAISDFLEDTKTGLILLSRIESVKAQKEEGKKELLFLVDRLKSRSLADIVRVDKEGRVVWGFMADSQEVPEKGVDLSDRDYFIWARKQKKSGEVYIGEPLTSRGGIEKGNLVIVMAAPVFYQDEFNGLVFASFSVEGLTREYIDPLVTSPELKVSIIADDGIVMVSTIPQMTGKNIIDRVQANEGKEGKEEFIRMIRGVFSGEEGLATHYYLSPDEPQKKAKLITAYSPITANGVHWSLWLSAPYNEVAGLTLSLESNQTKGLILGLGGVVTLIFLLVFGFRVIQRDAFLDGFSDGSTSKKIKNKS